MLDARRLLLLLVAVSALGGCKGWVWQPRSDTSRGRYAGVGIYAPGPGWRLQSAGQRPLADRAARLSDDGAVIVVIDSRTGEVRGCGDLSGYCIGMNPWRADLAKPQQAPVDLTEHAKLSVDVPAANSADNAAAAPAR